VPGSGGDSGEGGESLWFIDQREAGEIQIGQRFFGGGDYRVVARIEDERITVLVVRVAHRREVYR